LTVVVGVLLGKKTVHHDILNHRSQILSLGSR
jgi:hypothetical protein